jgi:hypothetical protein
MANGHAAKLVYCKLVLIGDGDIAAACRAERRNVQGTARAMRAQYAGVSRSSIDVPAIAT